MREPDQLELFQETTSDRSRTIDYIPPDKQALRSYAQAIYHRLIAGSDGALEKEQSDNISGLSSFLDVITRIQASALSREEQSHEK